MNLFEKTLASLKTLANFESMVAQRRANLQVKAGQPTAPSGGAQTTHPGQSQLTVVSGLAVDERALREEDSGTKHVVPLPAHLGQSALFTRQQSPPPVTPAAPNRSEPETYEQVQPAAPSSLPRRLTQVTKAAEKAISGLLTELAHSFQIRSRTDQNSATASCGWKCIGASVVGTSHMKKKKPCQDAWQIEQLPSGELVIAVADGAGSAPRSQEGASLAVRAAADYLGKAILLYQPDTRQAWEELIAHSFDIARAVLILRAVRCRTLVKEYATTLQIVVVSSSWTVCGIVGDGSAVGLSNNHSLVSLAAPQRGEYANATNFITDPAAPGKLVVQAWQTPVAGVAVLTDGLLHVSVNDKDNTPVPAFFESLFNFLDASASLEQAANSLTRFLESDRINRRTDDDKTLVLALRTTVQRT